MAGHNSWRQMVNYGDWMGQIEKRLLNVERQPVISHATDLLGPGAGPYAVQIKDWNADEATFVGVFYSNPTEGQANSPDNNRYWMGETFGTEFGDGFQRLTEFSPLALVSPDRFQRRFTTIGGVRLYSDWETL